MIKKYKITNIRKNNYTWYRWYSVIEDIDILWTKIKNLDVLEDYYCIRILTQKNFWFAFGDVSLGNYESGKLEKYKYI